MNEQINTLTRTTKRKGSKIKLLRIRGGRKYKKSDLLTQKRPQIDFKRVKHKQIQHSKFFLFREVTSINFTMKDMRQNESKSAEQKCVVSLIKEIV